MKKSIRQRQLGRLGLPDRAVDPPALAVEKELEAVDTADERLVIRGGVADLVGAERLEDFSEGLAAPGHLFGDVAAFEHGGLGVEQVAMGREVHGHGAAVPPALGWQQAGAVIEKRQEAVPVPFLSGRAGERFIEAVMTASGEATSAGAAL